MKNQIKALLLTGAVIAASTISSLADVAVTSFQFTNVLNPATSIISNPTNTPGTNGLGVLTGKWVDTANFDKAGFTVTATTTATNTGYLTFVLIRANVSGSPATTDFETLPLLTISAPVVVGTNVALVWTTNTPDSLWLNASTHVGIYSGTNTCMAGSGTTATNVVVKITRKKVAVSY